MKTTTTLFALLFFVSIACAQKIQFEEANPAPVFPGALAGAMDFADVDADGDMDIFICGRVDGWTSVARSALYLNDGNGGFAVDSFNTFPNLQFAGAVFEDIDGDGDQDLLLSGRGDFSEKKAGLYLNDGNGNFSLSMAIPFEPCENGGFAVGDVDGDTDLDVYQFGQKGILGDYIPFISFFRNLGNGQFEEIATPQLINFNHVALADLDGDNDLDLVARFVDQNIQPTTVLFENDGTGAFQQVASYTLGNLSDSYLAIGDLDGDSHAEILVSGLDTNNKAATELYLADDNWGYTLFTGNDTFPDLFAGNNSFHDFDNDGDLDILLTGSTSGGLTNGIFSNIFENEGNNNYTFSDSLTGSYLTNNAVGDINGDGFLDLVLSGTTVGLPTFKTWAYLNLGQPVVSIDERQKSFTLNVFPNPTSGTLTIATDTHEAIRVELYSVTGQRLWVKQIQGQGATELQLQEPTGLYLLVVHAEGERLTRKVSVLR